MSIRWSNLKVCGLPVVIDPTLGDDTVEVRDGDKLIVTMHLDDEGRFIGSTGHVSQAETDEDRDE